MRHILIIEDEPINADRLKRMLLDLDDTLIIDGPLSSVQQVLDQLKMQNDYDLIFSDIRLGNQTVFEAFHEIMPNSFVIFTTAYDEYAMEAIHSNGIDYLLKPFDIKDLQNAIHKIYLSPQNSVSIKEGLFNITQEFNCFQERFLVSKGEELISLCSDEISCFKRDNDKTKIITANGGQYEKHVSLLELEKKLSPQKFFRVNRQYIANINHIKKISLFFKSKLTLRIDGCSDDYIIVSQERSALLKKLLDK